MRESANDNVIDFSSNPLSVDRDGNFENFFSWNIKNVNVIRVMALKNLRVPQYYCTHTRRKKYLLAIVFADVFEKCPT